MVTWQEAERSCKSQGGDLPSITDKATNDFLMRLNSKQPSWIGLKQHPNEGSWTALGSWTDGSPWCFQNWGKGEPNDLGGKEDFGQTNWGGPGKWNDRRDHYWKHGYFCQK